MTTTEAQDVVEQSFCPPPHRFEFVYPYVLELMPEGEWIVDGKTIKLAAGYRLMRKERV